MAVVSGSVKLLGPGGGADALDASEVTTTWAARTDNAQDEADTVLEDSAVVKVGDQLITTAGFIALWAHQVQARRDPKVHTKWTVDVTYNRLKPKGYDTEKNPLLRPAKTWWTFEDVEIFLAFDRKGNDYKNTAGDTFKDPPPTVVTMTVLNSEKNLSSFDILDVAAAQNAINLDSFLGFLPGYAQVAALQPSEPEEEDGVSYITMTTAIYLSPILLQPYKILNQGARYLDAPDGNLVENNTDGVYSAKQVLLAVDGTKLPKAGVWNYVDTYPFPEMSFVNLPQLTGLVITP